MTDQPYLSWSHALVSGGAERTPIERAADVFNIKDYYHTVDGSDWQPAIQRAVDAASVSGGIVFIPPGHYGLLSRVFIPYVGGANIQIIGCGGWDGTRGSVLNMSVKDYIIYGSDGPGHSSNISLIAGIVFKNTYTGSDPVNIAPPNTDWTTLVTGTQAGVSGVVRVLCATLIGSLGASALVLETLEAVAITGIGGTTEALGTHTINAPNYDLLTWAPTTQSGTAGKVRILGGGFDTNFGKGIKAGDVITVAGITNVVGGASNEANGSQTVLAVSIGNYVEINVVYANEGIGGTIRGNWIDLVGTTFVNAWTSGGTVAFSGDGSGCVYVGGGIGNVLRDCYFAVGTGVGYFNGGFGGTVDNCTFQGGYGGGAGVNNSIAIMARSLAIRGGKISGLGTGIAMFKGMSSAKFLDIERCGIGILVGQNPIPYIDSNEDDNLIQAGNNVCAKPGVVLEHIVMESNAVAFIKLEICFGTIRDIAIQSFGQIGTPDYGIDCDGASGVDFYRVEATGEFDIAGINVGAASSCEFRYCSASQSGGAGVDWILPTSQISVSNGLQWTGCSIDGALALAILPASAYVTTTMLCSDSTDAAYSGGVSNVGKAIVGGGGNKVLARWNGTAWAIAG